jgi:DNA-binding NarL/FixJ family response regulator
MPDRRDFYATPDRPRPPDVPMKVLIADDHPLLRDALARALRLVQPDAEVIEAADADGTARALALHLPVLALVDLHMPGMERVEGVRRLCARFGALRIAVASGDDDPAVIRSCLAAGAVGFLPKSADPESLQQALRLLLDGEGYLPPQALADARGEGRGDGRDGRGEGATAVDGAQLTPRQRDVLRCLMRGDPNKVIARELGLTEGTVKIHIAAILRALQVRNRTEAVVVARQLGL